MATRSRTTKTPSEKTLTAYQVQRRFPEDAANQEHGDLWLDVGVFRAYSGTAAVKSAAAKGEITGGSYRAFPVRSDSRLDVAVETRTIPLFTVPATASSNGQPDETKS